MLSKILSNALAKTVLVSLLGVVGPWALYLVVKTHFDAKAAATAASKYQENQRLYNDLAIQMSDKMKRYKQAAQSKKILCAKDLCTVPELKAALNTGVNYD